jgi:phospholipase/lecithinase/hemolysin
VPSRYILILITILSIVVMGPGQIEAAMFSDMVVFGDSLSDVGNINTLSLSLYPPAPYYNGRFSNGPLWNEWLSQDLGLSAATPFLQGGLNYAFGGAETDFNVPPLEEVLGDSGRWGMSNQVWAHSILNEPSPESLFVLWGGSNEILQLEGLCVQTNNVPCPLFFPRVRRLWVCTKSLSG